ncbi:MAG: amidohydrolase family protein [Planctomycetes bacterium]|nr:amidohydrolase family protein [Planctomycetota bacterium]
MLRIDEATRDTSDRRPRYVRTAMVVDAGAVCAAPGALLLRDGAIVAAGAPSEVPRPVDALAIERDDLVVFPALVNAHCHLDLSHLGPRPFDGDFTRWIDRLRAGRAEEPDAIAEATRRGVALARAGGTALVGDIAGVGSAVPARVLRDEGLGGVSYLEVFGLGEGQERAIAALRRAAEHPTEADGVRQGLQPHAPYSCGPEVYRAAAALGRPLSTHLAETPEEEQFVRAGAGPLAEMLLRLGVWNETIPPAGRHPVDAVLEWLGGAPVLAAHANYLGPEHARRLASANASIAYCPRASAYFGHPRDGASPHQYRALIDAGVNVVLGTDSLVCLDTPDRLSVLDDMRLLYRRDGTDPRLLLRMATTAAARALGFDDAPYDLRPGPSAGILAVTVDPGARDPLAAALRSDAAPAWLLGPMPPGRGS